MFGFDVVEMGRSWNESLIRKERKKWIRIIVERFANEWMNEEIPVQTSAPSILSVKKLDRKMFIIRKIKKKLKLLWKYDKIIIFSRFQNSIYTLINKNTYLNKKIYFSLSFPHSSSLMMIAENIQRSYLVFRQCSKQLKSF